MISLPEVPKIRIYSWMIWQSSASQKWITEEVTPKHIPVGSSYVWLQLFIFLFNLVGLGRGFFVCCLAHRGSTVGFLLLKCSSGVVRHPMDLQVSVATRFCRVLIFASS